MIKRIFLIALCIALLTGTVSFASYSDVDSESIYGKAIAALSDAGILSGYGDGTFGSKDHLTRAQFAKIVVCLTGNENGAKSKMTEVFTDVPVNHWAVGYINEAASWGMITGYPDGSFCADEKITFAQALTVIIRMLGYTESEVGTNWPQDYINKAAELEITKGITFGRNEYVSREVAAFLLYNSLEAKTGSGAIANVVKKVDDAVIYGVTAVNSGIAADEVLTTAGSFKKGKGYKDEYLGRKATLRVNSDNEIVMIIPEVQDCTVYTAISASGDELETIENGTIDIEYGRVAYYKGKKSTFKDISAEIALGSKAYVYDEYIYVEDSANTINEETLAGFFGNSGTAIDTEWIINAKGEVIKKVEDVVIYGVNSINSAIASDQIMTTGGLFKKGRVFDERFLGKKVELRVDSENNVIAIIPEEQEGKMHTVVSAFSDKMETKEGKSLDIDGNITAYYKGEATSYSHIYDKLNPGSNVYIYEDYMYVEEYKLKGPFTITKDYKQVYEFFGEIKEAGVTIEGEKAAVTDIEKYDVVYYNDKTGRIYVYRDKVTGIYEKAVPSKGNLTGIMLSGKEYNSISPDAKKKLDDSLGAFAINDRISLLFGHDGSVVDVVDISGRTLDDMGVLLKAYTGISSEEETLGKKEYYADIMLASGMNVTLKTDKLYSDKDSVTYTGKFMYITVLSDGTVKLEAAKENKLAGSFDRSVPSYAGHDFQQNYSILECVYSEKYDEAIVRKVSLRDISLAGLKEADVIHVEYANDFSDIAVMYINNVTYDAFDFGVLNKAVYDDEANYTYELKSAGGVKSYSGTAGWSYTKGEAVMVLVKNGKIKTIKGLSEVATGASISGRTDSKISVGGTTVGMDENVTVVYRSIGDSEWNVTTLKDLEENIESGKFKVSVITLYAERKGGNVRVIRVTLK